ncbi:hypothetical protein HPB52_006156 [Rhipicephalus sanguineus]|uniref:Lysosome-associated membrane glycoprotein 5 n=1 Tax=Rhipicephalus sanguineus TaxID=34632 RepID=A0A9D4T3F9_RHISA|nr:hypothetical protein HPB52_006156 [Rhipicephalus sanguineus]
MTELRRYVGPSIPISAVLAGVVLCSCLVQAIDYEETVVWQPDPQHKYVALREVKPRIQSRADDSLSPDLREESDQNAPGTPVVPPKAPIPEFSFGVWNATDGTVCILAKFQVFFTITYASRGGLQTVTLKMPESAKAKGICATEDQEPVLELTWPVFRFILMFSRVPPVSDKGRGSWKVSGMEIQFNTNSPFFPGATNGKSGKRTARSPENMTLFETPMGESYFCPTPKLVTLTDSRGGRKVAVQFKDLRIQAYEFQGTYGPAHRCSQVRMAGVQDPFPQDETVPIAVGSTLAVAAVAVVVGYALYRSVFVRRVDYNTMN